MELASNRNRSRGLWLWLWILFLLLSSLRTPLSGIATGQELQQLSYGDRSLTVDLGVGLWAWPIPIDADKDGDYDLLVSCPDKPSNGIWFFENTSGDTRQHKLPRFAAGKRISPTTHYVMPSYVNGETHLLSPGKEYLDFATLGTTRSVPLSVKANFYQPTGTQPKGPKVRHNQWRYVDYDGDTRVDLIVGIEDWSHYGWDDAWDSTGQWTNGKLQGKIFFFRNTTATYDSPIELQANDQPLRTFGCPSPNFEDFDKDGDLDLLCGEFLDQFTYFENQGTRTEPKYAAGKRLLMKDNSPLAMDLQMIVPVAFDWDRDGDADLIVGDEDGRVAFVENTGELSAEHYPLFSSPKYFQQVADTLKCGALATPYCVDWDGDQDIDIVSGNTAGYIELFENISGAGVEKPQWLPPKRIEVAGNVFRILAGSNGSIQGPAEAKWGYTTLSVADWNRDGKNDIVFNSIWGKVQWLENIGSIKNPQFAPPQPIEVQWNGETPKPTWTWWKPQGKELVTQWRTTPMVYDLNHDQLADLVMLDSEGYLAFFQRAQQADRLVLLPPRRILCDEKGTPLRLNAKTAGGSGRRKLTIVDWDGDGIEDLLVNSANADFYRGLGIIDGAWRFEREGSLAAQNIEGHDVSPATADFDNNGIPDFVGGAEDGRFYYLRNPRAPF